MSSWIKMRCDLRDDPAVIAMAIQLDVDVDLVVGKLHRAWSWADVHTINGEVPHLPALSIDLIVELDGFTDAMVDAGWLVIRDGRVVFPDFDKYQPNTAKSRAANAERQRRLRANKAVVEVPAAPTPTPTTELTNFGFLTKAGPWVMSVKELEQYEATFPTVDVPGELLKIALWLNNNPRRVKTDGSGTKRMITTWLNKTQKDLASKRTARSSSELFSEDF